MKSKPPAPSVPYYMAIIARYERVRHFKTNEALWSQFDVAGKRHMNKVIMACYIDCLNEGLLGEIERLP